MYRKILQSFVFCLTLLTVFNSSAKEIPPANAMPLSQIIKILEGKGYNPIIQVELDNGTWEVEAYRDNQKLELRVHPVSGKIISEQPDD